MVEKNELKGLQGWLILVGIGIVAAPVRMLYSLVPVYKPIFEDGSWEAISVMTSELYNPSLSYLIIGEIIINAIIFIGALTLIYYYFKKHYLFPKVYISLILLSLIFIPLDAWIVTKVLPGETMFDPETMKEFLKTILAVVIWVPYMLISERVKLTFVKNTLSENIEPATSELNENK